MTERGGNSLWIHWRTFVEWAALTVPRSLNKRGSPLLAFMLEQTAAQQA